MLEAKGIAFELIDYLRDPPTREQLHDLVRMINEPADLVRRQANQPTSELSAADLTDAERIVDFLVEHPELLQRPIAVCGQQAMIGRPPERILELFTDD